MSSQQQKGATGSGGVGRRNVWGEKAQPYGIKKSAEATTPRNRIIGDFDVTEVLTADHNSLRTLFRLYKGRSAPFLLLGGTLIKWIHNTFVDNYNNNKKIDTPPDSLEKKRKLADDIIKDLCIHAGIEVPQGL